MTKYQNADALQSLTLGEKTEYTSQYDASLLQGVPRSLNRQDLNLGESLPFTGCDLWTLYELSWLNDNGLPQVAIGEVSLPVTTPNLIESKSFKLYLNSFNQTRFSSWEAVVETLTADLSQCAGGEVSVTLKSLQFYSQQPIINLQGVCIDDQNITIENYEFNPDYLTSSTSAKIVEETLHSHLLKSNCLITNQPDWGSIEIHYRGNKIDHEKLLRYLVSFRQHNEFHEQCVERIYTDITRFCSPESLTVFARYTRRGGLDINPFRSSHRIQPDHNLRLARQ